MRGHISPYHAPDFYKHALAQGRHRDIVGGRWDETGRIQMQLLLDAGLRPHHRLLDIGCGSLRLGCRAVPYLDPGQYWGTDLSGALMRKGYEAELADKTRLPPAQLIEDADFSFPGVPDTIDFAIAFAVFTHLPLNHLRRALTQARSRLPRLRQDHVRDIEQALQRSHLERLKEGRVESIETSNIHQETLRALKQVNTAFTQVAYPILSETGDLLSSRLTRAKRG